MPVVDVRNSEECLGQLTPDPEHPIQTRTSRNNIMPVCNRVTKFTRGGTDAREPPPSSILSTLFNFVSNASLKVKAAPERLLIKLTNYRRSQPVECEAMDALLPRLLSFPPHPPPPQPLSDEQYDSNIKAHITMVAKCSDKHLLALTSSGENTLNVINPATHTVPYIFTLLAQISEAQQKGSDIDRDWLWVKVSTFMVKFDQRQMRYIGAQFEKLIQDVRLFARRCGQPPAVITPIRDAIIRLDPSGSMLTSTHLLLVKLSLETRYFIGAVPVIEKPILYFPGSKDQPKPKYPCDLTLATPAYITPESGLTSKLRYVDLLEYFLCSGMIFIGLRNWEKALECLENAVTYPAKDGACSKIMVAAYKKWILVSLLLEGKPISLPKTTSSGASKLYHTLAKPYETVATLFETATASRLKSEVDFGVHIWNDDCNTGLMLNVLAAYQKFQIRRLADVYSKISTPEIANLTMSAETGNRTSTQMVEDLIQSMIQDRSLQATMSSSPGKPSILTFTAGGTVLSEAQMRSELTATTQRIQALGQDIKITDRLLTHDKEYIKHVAKMKKNAKDLGDRGDVSMKFPGQEMDWNNNFEEEDLMAEGLS